MHDPKDPIFKAIAAHKAAEIAYSSAIKRADDDDDLPEGRAERAAYAEMLETTPTTLAGVRAAIEYLIEMAKNNAGVAREETTFMLDVIARSPALSPSEAN